mmetsp:Transcript_5589/g.8655  ORF Transcript_5589/g.8655 Transcript_5589/m.8655 type:complete len:103 (-) Transcript_5589:85-393(-)
MKFSNSALNIISGQWLLQAPMDDAGGGAPPGDTSSSSDSFMFDDDRLMQWSLRNQQQQQQQQMRLFWMPQRVSLRLEFSSPWLLPLSWLSPLMPLSSSPWLK